MMDSIVDVLMRRDGMTQEDAESAVECAREDLRERLAEGEMPFEICEEHFGLELDYVMELL